MNTQLLSIKAKKFGVRLSGFRQKKGVSTDALSLWTGLPKEEIEKIESGEFSLSLPLIELIALKLGLPTDTLLYGELDSSPLSLTENDHYKQYSALRDRMIALILRKNRTEQGKSLEDVSFKCGITADQLNSYEIGNISIPLPVLECLCTQYQLPINSLFSTIAVEETQPQKTDQEKKNQQIPLQLEEFIQNPANLPYLELAKKLSELDAAKLRSIAEGLLEITY